MGKKSFKNNVNLISGNEKIYMEFQIGKAHEGKERIFLKNSTIDEQFLLSEFNSDMKQEIIVLNKEFIIKDKYNEKRKNNKIGTTIVNLLNEDKSILKLIDEYLNIIQAITIEDINKKCSEISDIIKKFKIEDLDSNFIIDNCYKIYNTNWNDKLELSLVLNQENDNINNLMLIIDFLKDLYLLENNYIKQIDLINLVELILHKNNNFLEIYQQHLIMNTMKVLEDKLSNVLAKPLKFLLRQMFQDFYRDCILNINEKNIIEILKIYQYRYNQYPHNTYYKKVAEYINNLYNKFMNEKRKLKRSSDTRELHLNDFSKSFCIDVCQIFLKTIIYDINFMEENYQNENLKFIDNRLVNKFTNCYEQEISSFGEMFFISLYFIFQDKTLLKRCKTCKKFFIADKPQRDKNCQRIYKNNLTCRSYADKNYRSRDEISNQISRKENAINTLLNIKFQKGKITSQQFKNINDKIADIKINNNLSEESKLENLENLHNQIKNIFSTKSNV